MSVPITVRVQAEAFDINAEIEQVKRTGSDVGAIVAFTGVCRAEKGRLTALELEYYPGMAEDEITRIVEETAARWPLSAVTVVHRYGRIAVGDNITVVVIAAEHRQAAFDAAGFLMDYMKTRAPFWKKEHLAGGAEGGWVEPRAADQDATGRH